MKNSIIEKKKLELSRERLNFEIRKHESESNFLQRHFPAIISGAISLAALIISGTQLVIASGDRALEREISDRRFEIERKAIDQKNKRDWQLDVARFLTENATEIFEGSEEQKNRMRGIIISYFPEKQATQLFSNIDKATPVVSRGYWQTGVSSEFSIIERVLELLTNALVKIEKERALKSDSFDPNDSVYLSSDPRPLDVEIRRQAAELSFVYSKILELVASGKPIPNEYKSALGVRNFGPSDPRDAFGSTPVYAMLRSLKDPFSFEKKDKKDYLSSEENVVRLINFLIEDSATIHEIIYQNYERMEGEIMLSARRNESDKIEMSSNVKLLKLKENKFELKEMMADYVQSLSSIRQNIRDSIDRI